MQDMFFHLLFLVATFLGASGILFVIWTRDTATRTSKLFILMLILIFGYLISHGIHFLLMYNKDVTILDISCHSFLLLILITMTFLSSGFSKKRTKGKIESLLILVPSIIILGFLWSGRLIQWSHSHLGTFDAHYEYGYPLFLIWYVTLIFYSIFITVQNILKEEDEQLKNRLKVFLLGVVITNLFTFTFGLLLPWVNGFYDLVEVSPLAFLSGVILFTGISIDKYNMFPATIDKINRFSIKRKMFFSAVIIVPMVILIIQIPLGKILFGIDTNVDLIRYFLISLFVGIIVSLSMTFAVIQIISNPLRKLKVQAGRIETGELGVQFEYPSNDEIGELSAAFNKLSNSLKKNALELTAKENRINILLNAIDKSAASIVLISEDLTILEANQQFVTLVGDDLQNIKGKILDTLPVFAGREIIREMVKASADSGQHSEEITFPGEVEDRIILVSLSKIKTVYNTSGFMFVGLDITKQKKLERELAHSEKLAALGKMSTVLAHEIKTPLTSIKLNVEMLLESLVLSQEDNSSFRIIQKEINRMNGLVNDVLQLSRVYVLNYSSVMMNRFTENIIEEVRNKVQQKSLQVKNMVKTVELEIDSDKMRQVLLNMIDNAIEASDDNGIIELISEVNEERNKFSLKIKNGCTEMPDIGKIFVPFYTNKVSGTGLGLSISRNIVEQHYGEIILSLAQENQIEFTIILPILRS